MKVQTLAVCFQALLTRVAKTGQGAVELLRCGLVAQLIECQVFDMVPDSDAHRYGCEKEGRRWWSDFQVCFLSLENWDVVDVYS